MCVRARLCVDFDPRLRSTEATGARRAQEATPGESDGKRGEGRCSAEDGQL